MEHKVKLHYLFTTLFILFLQLNFWLETSTYSAISGIQQVRSVCMGLGIICLLAKVWFASKIGERQLWWIVLAIILIVLGMYVSKGQMVMKMLLFGIAVKDVPFEKVTKDYLRINTFIFAFIVMSSLVGIIENKIIQSTVTCYCLGFKNPNTASIMFFSVLASYNFLYYKKMNLRHLFAEGIIVSAILLLTKSRACMVTILIMFILMVIDKYVKNIVSIFRLPIFKEIILLNFGLFTVLSYFLGLYWKVNSKLNTLNVMLSWRLWYWHKYTSTMKITLLGDDFSWDTLGTLDNGYLVVLYKYGLIIWTIYFFIFYILTKYCLENRNSSIFILILSYEFYCLMESYPLMANSNIVILFFFGLFWNYWGKNRGNIECL